MNTLTKTVSLAITVASALFLAFPLHAESENSYSYPYNSLYKSAYRFLVLDKGFDIKEENQEMGLIKFVYNDGSMTDTSASLEIIRDSSGKGVSTVRLNIPSISGGTTGMILSELNKKINGDFSGTSANEKIFNTRWINFHRAFTGTFPSK